MSTISKMRDEVRALRGQVSPRPQRIIRVIKGQFETTEAALKREGIRCQEGDFLIVREIVGRTRGPTMTA